MTNPEYVQTQVDAQTNKLEKSEAQRRIEQLLEELENMNFEYEKEGQTISDIGEFNTNGGQELIDKFGLDKVMLAVTRARDTKEWTLYKVICLLEPDRNRRSGLYETMLESATERQIAFEQDRRDGLTTISGPQEWISDQFGPTRSNLKDLKINVDRFAKADGFYFTYPEGPITAIGLMDRFSMRLRSLGRAPFVNYIAQLYGLSIDDSNRISENNGDLLATVIQVKTENEQRKRDMFDKRQATLREIATAMEANVQLIEEKYLEAANSIAVDRDFSSDMQKEFISQAGTEASERSITDLSESLRILEERAAEELEEINRPLIRILNNLTSSYYWHLDRVKG